MAVNYSTLIPTQIQCMHKYVIKDEAAAYSLVTPVNGKKLVCVCVCTGRRLFTTR